MCSVSRHKRQFDNVSGFVRRANKYECLRFNPICVYKTHCNSYQYPYIFLRLISAVHTQSLCISYTLNIEFCFRESFCFLIESISNQKAADTCCLTFGTGVSHLIQINHKYYATIFRFIILTFVYSSTCFGRFPAHHQELNDCSGSLWFYLRFMVIVVLCSWSGRPAGKCRKRVEL
jgi:hypothetical protein